MFHVMRILFIWVGGCGVLKLQGSLSSLAGNWIEKEAVSSFLYRAVICPYLRSG